MLPGPVFNFELVSTARRGRFYAIRAFYATVLLIILWAVHSAWSSTYNAIEMPTKMVKWFALSALGGITVGQEILVLVLTPALVAGVIADEKKRRTLHYLMASQLTSSEIVLGKLFVRMLYVGVLLGVSVPVLSLLVMLGGIDPWLVVLGCGPTLSSAWFLATMSIWVSTIARRPREALFIAYGLEGLWLMVPSALSQSLPIGVPMIDIPAYFIVDWLGASSPGDFVWHVIHGVNSLMWSGILGWQEMIYWMIALQAGAGVVLAILAALQLRPLFKRQDDSVGQRRGLRAILSPRRMRSLPRLGDRPMLWKELHTSRARGFARFVGWMLTLVAGGFLVYYGVWYGTLAFLEMWEYGYGHRELGISTQHRWNFFSYLIAVVPLLYLFGVVTIAGAAAAAITSEHEEDTWVSLTTTDLTGREILVAKLLGAMKRASRLWILLGLLVVVGIVVESLHGIAFPAIALALAVYGWFAAALGLWISLQLRSTWRAQFLTIAVLLLVNIAGQGVLNTLAPRGFAPQVWPGFTPYEVGKLVMSPDILTQLSKEASMNGWPRFWRLWDVDGGLCWLTTFSVMSLVTYAGLAAFLTSDALRRFEVVAGRARRAGQIEPNSLKPGVRIEVKLDQPAVSGSVA